MSDEKPRRAGLLRFLPVAVFLAVAAAFWIQLAREDKDALPSTFIGREAPATPLPALLDTKPGMEPEALKSGGVKIVNVFASWCAPCRVEHPFLMQLAAEGVEIIGINYKDKPDQAKAFLSDLGDPYAAIGSDENGRAGIEWGVYGVPESFVIDGAGRIIYKHIGPIQNDDLDAKIRPALAKAAGG